MSQTIRRIAVSGSAAVALLGGAAAITTVTAPQASAAEQQATVHRVTAPVNLPDGRTVRITGLGGYGHTATDAHVATVAAFKTETSPSASPDLTTGITPGAGTQLPNPLNGQQTGYNQQITTQAGGGTISLTVAIGIALLAVVIVMVRKGHVKFAQAFACVALGVYLAPTFFGPLIQQLGGSAATGLGNVWAGF